MSAAEDPSRAVLRLRVALRDLEPTPWRRIEVVVADTSLAGLHHVIQVAMNWEDQHLHCFQILGRWLPCAHERLEEHVNWGGAPWSNVVESSPVFDQRENDGPGIFGCSVPVEVGNPHCQNEWRFVDHTSDEMVYVRSAVDEL